MIDVRRSVILAVAQERKRMHAELTAVKCEMLNDYYELRRQLDDALTALHELRALHARACGQRAEIARMRALTAFAAAQRDPAVPLN